MTLHRARPARADRLRGRISRDGWAAILAIAFVLTIVAGFVPRAPW